MALRDRLRPGASAPVLDHSGHGDAYAGTVALYRRRLLEEIDLAELAKLDAEPAPGAPGAGARAPAVAARGRCSPRRERQTIIRRVVDEALGLGVLEPLLADETVTEIMVNGPDTIFVERAGRLRAAADPRSPPTTSCCRRSTGSWPR